MGISFNVLRFVVGAWLGLAVGVSGQENAAVFSTLNTVPDLATIRKLATGATVAVKKEGKKAFFVCKWNDVTVTVTVDPDYDYKVQRAGLRGWLLRAAGEEVSADVRQALPAIAKVRQCYPCQVEPGFDANGNAFRFVTALSRDNQGLIFSHQSLYDKYGCRIEGTPGDPQLLAAIGNESMTALGKPLTLTKSQFVGDWEHYVGVNEDGILLFGLGDESLNDDGTYTDRGRAIIAVAGTGPLAVIEYEDKGRWRFDRNAMYFKSSGTKILSKNAAEEFPLDEFVAELAAADEDFERSVVYYVSADRYYLVDDEGMSLRMTRKRTGPEFTKAAATLSMEELGGDPTAKASNEPDLEGEAIRRKSMAAATAAGFKPATSLPTSARRAGVEGRLREHTEIRSRLLAMYATVQWVLGDEDTMSSAQLKTLRQKYGIGHHLTEKERAILKLSRDEAQKTHRDRIGWTFENMWPLAWALGFEKKPPLTDGMITGPVIREVMAFCESLVTSPKQQRKLPNQRQIRELEDLFYCTHNAVRSGQLGHANFVPKGFHPVRDGGVVHERRHALSWMLSPGVKWDDTDLST